MGSTWPSRAWVALAISAGGTKKTVGLWDGTTEHKTVVPALLVDLVERGLTLDDALLSGPLRRRGSGAVGEVSAPRTCAKEVSGISGASSLISGSTMKSGWSVTDCTKLAGQNILRVIHEAESVAKSLAR